MPSASTPNDDLARVSPRARARRACSRPRRRVPAAAASRRAEARRPRAERNYWRREAERLRRPPASRCAIAARRPAPAHRGAPPQAGRASLLRSAGGGAAASACAGAGRAHPRASRPRSRSARGAQGALPGLAALGSAISPGAMIEIPVELGDRAATRSPSATGWPRPCPSCWGACAGRRFVVVSNARIWSLHGARVEKPLSRLASRLDARADPRRREVQDARDAGPRPRRVPGGGPRPRRGGGGLRRRRGGRPGRLRRRHLHARPRSGCRCRPRCWPWWTARWAARWGSTTPRPRTCIGRLPPAQGGGRSIPPSSRRCPPRELRSGAYEVLKCGDPGRPRAVRGAGRRAPRGSAELGAAWTSRTPSPPPAASRPRSWRRTSARTGCAAS